MNFEELCERMKKDQRFSHDLGYVEFSFREQDGGPSIDYSGVAQFQIVAGDTKFALACPISPKALDFLDFLRENDVKEFLEVTFFWDGPDKFRVFEFDEDGEPVTAYSLRQLLRALLGQEVTF